jgi:signal transduction histidine kinase
MELMLPSHAAKPLRDYVLPALVLFVLVAYAYGRFFVVPYLGFQVNGSDGQIVEVFVGEELQAGDFLLQVNELSHETYSANPSKGWLLGFKPQEQIHLLVDRNGQLHEIDWTVSGFNVPEFLTRLLNTWWLSFAFWLAGTVTLLLVRPRDRRWALLVAFNYVTAIWFMAGSLSSTGVYASPLVFRAAIWLSWPIYWQLHWAFPRRWRILPNWVWYGFYALCLSLAVLQWLWVIPKGAYTIPLLLAVAGSMLMLLARLKNPVERREVVILLVATAVAFIPSAISALITAQGESHIVWAGLVISLLALPGAYFYVVYRRQLGGLELRANRLIALYLFFVLLFIVTLVSLPLLSPFLDNTAEVAAAMLITGIFVSLVSVFGFARFQRFVERKLLGIPLPPERLLQDFARRISTSFTLEHLAQTLQDKVLPSLLIRQSALILLEPAQQGKPVYTQALTESELPDLATLQELIPSTAQAPSRAGGATSFVPWAQLLIQVRAGGSPQALWLLGRKDPDDYYSYAEERMLSSLADQMGIALVNIEQKNSLRTLYQLDIDRQETQQAHLARELHDDVLQEVNSLFKSAMLKGNVDGLSPQLHALNDRVRQLIHGLRPAMLDFGLYRALTELVDDLSSQPSVQTAISLNVPESTAEYESKVTEHVYRILQQAANNALKHSRATHLWFNGSLQPGCMELEVADDGVGFDLDGADPAHLLSSRHYGLAGMNERAALIGARLSIASARGQGTRIHLYWKE